MTSIEWLIEQIKEYDFTPPSNNEEYVIVIPKWIFDAKIDEALEMHKQEIIDAYGEGFGWNYGNKKYNGKEYYQETFVSKGSDECQFEPTSNTSSATICKHCGREKYLHKL